MIERTSASLDSPSLRSKAAQNSRWEALVRGAATFAPILIHGGGGEKRKVEMNKQHNTTF
jgi:hypothetical protein